MRFLLQAARWVAVSVLVTLGLTAVVGCGPKTPRAADGVATGEANPDPDRSGDPETGGENAEKAGEGV